MTQKTQQIDSQQTLVYALIAIAVLLAAIVVFMIVRPSGFSSSQTGAAGSATAPSSTLLPAEMTKPTAVAFDPKTATQLPSDLTPETAMKAYSDAVMAGKWDTAYALLPLESKKAYGSAAGMGSQIKAYNVTGFKVGAPQTSGSDTSITLEEDTAQMNISYAWTFTKVGNAWYVMERKMAGGAPQ